MALNHRHVAADVDYLVGHKVAALVDDLVGQILTAKPASPREFLGQILNQGAAIVPPTPAAPASPDSVGKPVAKLIDGKQLAAQVVGRVKAEIATLAGPAPKLVVVSVGNDPASASYIKNKEKCALECGIKAEVMKLPGDAKEEDILGVVAGLNADPSVNGIIVQLPLPAHVNATRVTNSVDDAKDVDGLKPNNIGCTALNGQSPNFVACTPLGCLEMLKALDIPLRGKEAVVVGASNIVGVPMMLLLLKEGCTVSVCHIDTADTAAHTRQADILVVAVGKAHLVKKDWVKEGAIVIDVGINMIADPTKKSGRRMVGDVDFEEVRKVAGHISPVPGGVGPMTVAMLMQNTLAGAKAQRGLC